MSLLKVKLLQSSLSIIALLHGFPSFHLAGKVKPKKPKSSLPTAHLLGLRRVSNGPESLLG